MVGRPTIWMTLEIIATVVIENRYSVNETFQIFDEKRITHKQYPRRILNRLMMLCRNLEPMKQKCSNRTFILCMLTVKIYPFASVRSFRTIKYVQSWTTHHFKQVKFGKFALFNSSICALVWMQSEFTLWGFSKYSTTNLNKSE